MRTYRRLFQIFFLALILGSASGCAMFQPDDPGYNNPQRAQNIVRTASSQEGKQYRPRFRLLGPHLVGLPPERPQGPACDRGSGSGRICRAQELAPARRHHGLQDQQRPPRPAYRHLCRQQYLHPQPQPRQDRTPGEHAALLGQQAHRGTPHRHLIPLQERTKKARSPALFLCFFSRHPARQAALSRIPAFFLCGRRGWHLAIRSFLT